MGQGWPDTALDSETAPQRMEARYAGRAATLPVSAQRITVDKGTLPPYNE